MSEVSRPFGEMPLDSHRRLILESQGGMREYAREGRRLLELSIGSPDFALHQRLEERGVPVLPLLHAGENRGKADLLVPNEARTVQATLKFIARDIEGYKPVFAMVGNVLGRCEINGFGLPVAQEEQTILRSMAYSIDPNDEDFGGGVRLFPPYNFSHEASKTSTLDSIKHELMDSGYLNAPATDELIRITSVAWNDVRK